MKKESRKCIRCGSAYFNEDKTKNEVVCAKCGLVMKECMIDVEPEIIDELTIDEIRPEIKSKKK